MNWTDSFQILKESPCGNPRSPSSTNTVWSLRNTPKIGDQPVIRVLNGNLHPVAGTPSDPALPPHLGQQSGERGAHYGVRFQDFKDELRLFWHRSIS